MTQHELAQALGMPQPSIARIERGTVIPRTRTLLGILDATGHQLEVEPRTMAAEREPIRRRLVVSVPRRTRLALGRAARDPRTSPLHILRRLRRFGVPFVLVGEMAEAAHGVPSKIGSEVEVCRAQTHAARERLDMALKDLGADGIAERRLRLLTVTAAGDDYATLARNAVPMHVDAGTVVAVAAIDDLIRTRRARGTARDREIVAILHAIDRW